MVAALIPNPSFSFEGHDLIAQLRHFSQASLTGYWQLQFAPQTGGSGAEIRFLGLAQGKVIHWGSQRLSWTTTTDSLSRYIPRLRTQKARQQLLELEQELRGEQRNLIATLLTRLEKVSLASYDEAVQALRMQVLSDLDLYLYQRRGEAVFIPDFELVAKAPIKGFELETILADVGHRREQRRQLSGAVPSLDGIPEVNAAAMSVSTLSLDHQKQLLYVTRSGKSLHTLAEDLGKDPLDVAKSFVNLIRSGVITLKLPPTSQPMTLVGPEIFVVDDSPLLLKQFQNLVSGWGYQVRSSSNALTAVETMLTCQPSMIFLDINMPGATGFDVIKQIRRQPQLAQVPLTLLTAERSVSNQWRAQWANCKFLAKPRTPDEIGTFRTELQALLREVVPLEHDPII